MERKTYDIFDLTKYILSIAVVAIHCQLFPQVLFPWVRIAVPLFFIISSFLFFSKEGVLNESEKRSYLKKYMNRNLTLYFVWFIILLPFTVYERQEWFSEGILQGLFYSVRGFFFGSTFRASWFIMAGLIAMLIVYSLSIRINEKILVIIALLLYGCCCVFSTYSKSIDSSVFSEMYKYSKLIFGGIETSFFFAIIWIVIGKAYARRKIVFSKKQSVVGVVFSLILLYVEHVLAVNYLGSSGISSSYFTLIPLCMFIFQLLLEGEGIRIKNAKFLRNSSTIIYFVHCAVLLCVSWILRKGFLVNSVFVDFVITVVLVTLICFIFIRLSTFPRLKFLKKLW